MTTTSEPFTGPDGREYYLVILAPHEYGGIAKTLWKTWRLVRHSRTWAVIIHDLSLPWALQRQIFATEREAEDAARATRTSIQQGDLRPGWMPAHDGYRITTATRTT